MYEAYWNFTGNPFEQSGNPDFFFRSHTHQAALLKMRYLVESGKGAGMLVGGTGYGKTFLTEILKHELPEQFHPVVQLVFPQLSAPELLAYLAVELGAPEAEVSGHESSLDRTVRTIQRRFIEFHAEDRHPVIIIDEAHMIDDPRVFQALHLLLNFQNQPKVDFTLILAGERALLGRVRRLVQLDERIAVKSLLQPLTFEETGRYVVHRLEVAGATQSIFDRSALDTLFELSGGVPRKINRMCDLALLVGYADNLSTLSANEIEAVCEELTAVAPD